MSSMDNVLKSCKGVRVEESEADNWRGKKQISYKFFKVGEIVIPDDIFIQILATATKGTIGKVVSINFETRGERYEHCKGDANDTQIISYDNTIIYEVEGRKKTGRINSSHTQVLVGAHETKYVRDIQTHKKVEIKNPVNKFKQEMQRGDWVIGVKPGKGLGIGRITRWTNHTVWAVNGDDLDDKNAEFKFDSISETFTMPDSETVQELLTFAVLAGWSGR